MSVTTEQARLSVCPRCRSNKAGLRGSSPIEGVWTVYGCDICFYTWRSTEQEENTNPDKYPAVFRLNPEDLPNLQVAPVIPQLRKTAPKS